MAQGLYPDLSGERLAPAGCNHSLFDVAPILDDAGSLPRPNLECVRSFGVADTAIRHYLDLQASAMVTRKIPAWHEKIGKRQVKAPKVYVSDSGLLHSLLNLRTQVELESHPKVGASWEGSFIHELIGHIGARAEER